MKQAGSDIVIDMNKNSEGVFEKNRVRKTKRKTAKEDVRPDTLKKSRPAENVSRGRRKEPVESTVPNPVRDLQEGFQAGLEFLSGINTVVRLFK